MDTIEARLECLKLSASLAISENGGELATSEHILSCAKEWAAFVIGPEVKSSSSFGKKGADDPK